MPDSKLSVLTQASSLIAADIVYTVQGFPGSPASKYATWAQVAAVVGTSLGLAASATTDTTNAANISSGTLPVGRIGALGTPSSGTLTNCSGLPAAGVTGLSGTYALINNQVFTGTGTTLPALASINAVRKFTTVSATAATGVINFDCLTQGTLYYTTNASANFSLNVRGNSGATLDSILSVGDAVEVRFKNTNGATPFYLTALSVDGAGQTIKWRTKLTVGGGNASAIDVYGFEITKTAAGTFTVLGSMVYFG